MAVEQSIKWLRQHRLFNSVKLQTIDLGHYSNRIIISSKLFKHALNCYRAGCNTHLLHVEVF